jgi:MFS family permease
MPGMTMSGRCGSRVGGVRNDRAREESPQSERTFQMNPQEHSIATPLSGIKLLGVRRFRPYFLTQFLGAFNDNLFRNALIGLLAFQMTTLDEAAFGAAGWINVAAGIFILPFFLCSAMAGQLADRLDKAWLMRRVKFAEIPIMLLGGFAVVYAHLPLLMLSIGLMGAQSAFFGPAK